MSLELEKKETYEECIRRMSYNGKTKYRENKNRIRDGTENNGHRQKCWIGWNTENIDGGEGYKQSRKYKTSQTWFGKIWWKYIQMVGVLWYICEATVHITNYWATLTSSVI